MSEPVKGTGWRVRSWQAVQARRNRKAPNGRSFFRPSPTTPLQKWIEVPTEFKGDTQAFLDSKILKAKRESSTDQSTYHLREASQRAFKTGCISKSDLVKDNEVNKKANVGKHVTSLEQASWARRQRWWADADEDTLSWDFHSLGDPAAGKTHYHFFGDDADESKKGGPTNPFTDATNNTSSEGSANSYVWMSPASEQPFSLVEGGYHEGATVSDGTSKKGGTASASPLRCDLTAGEFVGAAGKEQQDADFEPVRSKKLKTADAAVPGRKVASDNSLDMMLSASGQAFEGDKGGKTDAETSSTFITVNTKLLEANVALDKTLQANCDLCLQVANLQEQLEACNAQVFALQAYSQHMELTCQTLQTMFASFPQTSLVARAGAEGQSEQVDERMERVERQCKDHATLLDKLAKGLGEAVQSSVDKRGQQLQQLLADSLKSHKLEIAQASFVTSGAIDGLIEQKFTELLQTQLIPLMTQNGKQQFEQLEAMISRSLNSGNKQLLEQFGDNKISIDRAQSLPTVHEEDGLASMVRPAGSSDKQVLREGADYENVSQLREVNSFVVTHSLKQLELNGRLGMIKAFDPSKERYAVALVDAEGEGWEPARLFKPSNLRDDENTMKSTSNDMDMKETHSPRNMPFGQSGDEEPWAP